MRNRKHTYVYLFLKRVAQAKRKEIFTIITIKISIESHKIFKCRKVLHSLCPTDLNIPEKIMLLCFLPEGIVRRVQEWAGKEVMLREAGRLHGDDKRTAV